MSLSIVLIPIELPASLLTEKQPHSMLIPLARAWVIAKINIIFMITTKIVAPSTITPAIRQAPTKNSSQGRNIATRFSDPRGRT